ncbi:hypothetical protein BP5796_04360 [Coleophoma crateriformis]|uniref:Uncharacterized protein n=1 Tax=Coleophoma crateriformis TaxID=565419 RepID=A0A3D8SI53_9HELO|nr:hypothetical protein BP5796_04360 [Coleophoma crateriformis]
MVSHTMKAVNYVGPYEVEVQEVEIPKLEHPDDIIVKVTTAAICGSDLHMYEGRTAAKPGITFGHENMGIVEEVGEGVTLLKKGDRVVMPFNVADGRCYVAMGPYRGGQAQHIRVPYADFNALKLPPGKENEADFILLADIFPTGWHGVEISGFQPGESIAVFGAGPVGLMAAYSAVLRGASQVYVIDRVSERLKTAERIGCNPIDFSLRDPVDQIIEHNGGMVDRSVDAVGYQAIGTGGNKEQPNIVLENMIRVTRPCGGLGIPGLYVPSDPGAPDEASAKGMITLSFGKLFEKARKATLHRGFLGIS